MIARGQSFILKGIDAELCEVEVDIDTLGLRKTTVVGLPDVAVRESIQRVRTAITNSGYPFPDCRITINLAPADTPKEGPVYDLPIAVAMLRACGVIAPPDPGAAPPDAGTQPGVDDLLMAGELALDGRVRPVRGTIGLSLLARRRRCRGVIVPALNAAEAAAVDGLAVYGAASLAEVVEMFNGGPGIQPAAPLDIGSLVAASEPEIDFADVRGQEAAKRSLAVAAAGGHNILLIGPPGTGKSMLARALCGILPPLSPDEVLEVTRIYSSAGRLPEGAPLVLRRPVRSPHHSASAAAIIGGGSMPRPGEVSLAHRGVLFLDEMPEFGRQVLETLRQPMEDGCVTIARARGSTSFPARFMLVAALNPTADGGAAVDERGRRSMDRYLARLSRPLIDRIDIHTEVPAVPYRQLASGPTGTDTETLRRQVLAARQRQRRRQGPPTNAELTGRQLARHAPLDEPSLTLLGQAMEELGLSARAYDKIRRVARTIADLEPTDDVAVHHVAEAVQYRLLDRDG